MEKNVKSYIRYSIVTMGKELWDGGGGTACRRKTEAHKRTE